MTDFKVSTSGHVITHVLKEGPVKITLSEAIGTTEVLAEVKYGKEKANIKYESLYDAKVGSLGLVESWIKSTLANLYKIGDKYYWPSGYYHLDDASDEF